MFLNLADLHKVSMEFAGPSKDSRQFGPTCTKKLMGFNKPVDDKKQYL